jgi:protein-S-isoprenylcysteine O-methyltransferase Ste14
MIAQMLIRTAVFIAVMALLLFVPADTLRWPAAWVYLAGTAILSVMFGLRLARTDPGLLQERMKPVFQPGQERWDKLLLAITLTAVAGWFVLMALDAVRFQTSRMPLLLQIVGAVAVVISTVIGFIVLQENSFAAPVVRLQTERGQHVVDTGLYAHVRHPMYAGAIPYFLGVPLLLGSWHGLWGAPVLTALLAARAVLEERTLIRKLPGYADYAARVRYRLIPKVW